MSQERVFRRGVFGIDEDLGPYAGFTAGETWNGWACPYFTRAVADAIATRWTALADGGEARYDSSTDAYVCTDASDPLDAPTAFQGRDICAGDGGVHVHVYPIGTMAWTWEEIIPGA